MVGGVARVRAICLGFACAVMLYIAKPCHPLLALDFGAVALVAYVQAICKPIFMPDKLALLLTRADC